MSKLKDVPKNFDEAVTVLNGRPTVQLDQYTHVEALSDGIAIRLHRTRVVKFFSDGRVSLCPLLSAVAFAQEL